MVLFFLFRICGTCYCCDTAASISSEETFHKEQCQEEEETKQEKEEESVNALLVVSLVRQLGQQKFIVHNNQVFFS